MDNTEILGRRMAVMVETQSGFIGYAFAMWRRRHPDLSLQEALGIDGDRLWQLAVTPLTTDTSMIALIAQEHGADQDVLAEMIRKTHETENGEE